MGSVQTYNNYKKSGVEKARYYTVTPMKRVIVAVIFLGLLALTTVGMVAVQVPLEQFNQSSRPTDINF